MTVRDVSRVLSREPQAVVQVQGSGEFSCIRGEVRFYQTGCGTQLTTRSTRPGRISDGPSRAPARTEAS